MTLTPKPTGAPFFWLTTYQIAANQLVSGRRLPWKIVPAVTDVSWGPTLHLRSPAAPPTARRRLFHNLDI